MLKIIAVMPIIYLHLQESCFLLTYGDFKISNFMYNSQQYKMPYISKKAQIFRQKSYRAGSSPFFLPKISSVCVLGNSLAKNSSLSVGRRKCIETFFGHISGDSNFRIISKDAIWSRIKQNQYPHQTARILRHILYEYFWPCRNYHQWRSQVNKKKHLQNFSHLSLSRMALHEVFCLKLLLLIWHYPWHLEKESGAWWLHGVWPPEGGVMMGVKGVVGVRG